MVCLVMLGQHTVSKPLSLQENSFGGRAVYLLELIFLTQRFVHHRMITHTAFFIVTSVYYTFTLSFTQSLCALHLLTRSRFKSVSYFYLRTYISTRLFRSKTIARRRTKRKWGIYNTICRIGAVIR